jgi:hypothetical protein
MIRVNILSYTYGYEQEIYIEPNIVIVKEIKSSGLRWAGHSVRMDDSELPKKIVDKPWRSTRTWSPEIKILLKG